MDTIQVVVDTNVIASAVRSKRGASFRLLSMLDHPGWQMNVSTALLLEYESVLKRELKRNELSLSIADDILDAIAMAANRRCIFFRWRPMLPDPKDDFILELAVAGGVPYIITFNRRDFRGVEGFGIHTLRPGEFLKMMRW